MCWTLINLWIKSLLHIFICLFFAIIGWETRTGETKHKFFLHSVKHNSWRVGHFVKSFLSYWVWCKNFHLMKEIISELCLNETKVINWIKKKKIIDQFLLPLYNSNISKTRFEVIRNYKNLTFQSMRVMWSMERLFCERFAKNWYTVLFYLSL